MASASMTEEVAQRRALKHDASYRLGVHTLPPVVLQMSPGNRTRAHYARNMS
jgi:hypothetical protein